ncbi:zinc finger protein ZFP2-like isoform X1 [Ornithodoros turicata]|uniref:zinc finger protein ZFP2-like isoform X1 n=1 Tax=Ornithodoros turicata TaxID=34597 RepID=UPI0031392316
MARSHVYGQRKRKKKDLANLRGRGRHVTEPATPSPEILHGMRTVLRTMQEARGTCVYEPHLPGPLESQLQEMQLSPELSGQLLRVKSEPLDEGQVWEQDCGVMAGTRPIKEEPQEESSDEQPIVEVKTEPYNIEILAEQHQTGQDCDSTLEGAKESTGMIPLKDKLRGTCDHASSCSTSSNAVFKICTTPFQPEFKNTANSRTTKQPSDQTETQQGSKLLMFGHEGDKLYKCNICSATCIDIGLLEVHLKTHETKAFTCNICSMTFRRPSTLRVHANRHTGGGSADKCNLYPAEVSRSIYPQRKKRYKCDLCPAEYRRHTSLWTHKQTHTGVRYKCELCPAEFSQSTSLLYHKRKHTGEKPYKCHLCPAEYSWHTSLWAHKQTHTGVRYKCELCPAEFSRSTQLLYHKRKHTGEKLYKCDLCPADFTQRAMLFHHKRLHTGEKPYKCDLCPAEFGYRSGLLHHKLKHTGEKPYKCDLCPAEFSYRRGLRLHKQTHAGEKPYKCDFCPKEFRHSSTLSRHRRRIHTGEKPYKCDLCPAEFTRSFFLSCHKRKHTVERPFKHDLCPAGLSLDTNLLYHSRKTYGRKKAPKSDL